MTSHLKIEATKQKVFVASWVTKTSVASKKSLTCVQIKSQQKIEKLRSGLFCRHSICYLGIFYSWLGRYELNSPERSIMFPAGGKRKDLSFWMIKNCKQDYTRKEGMLKE